MLWSGTSITDESVNEEGSAVVLLWLEHMSREPSCEWLQWMQWAASANLNLCWNSRAPAPVAVEGDRKLQCRELHQQKAAQRWFGYGWQYVQWCVLLTDIWRSLVYLVVVSCLVHHLMSLKSKLCSKKHEQLLKQASKKPKDFLFLTRIFLSVCWSGTEIFLPTEQ